MKGYIHVYTGDGKGKTTAAIGLAIRALGAGKKVCMIQFMKSLAYAEQDLLRTLPNFTLITLGKPYFLVKEGTMSEKDLKAMGNNVRVYTPGHPPKEYKDMIDAGLEKALAAVSSEYDLVILDEYCMAYWYDLVTDDDTLRILEARNPSVELVFTGRNAPPLLMEKADLITEMKKIRHYYDKGVMARKGVED